MLNDTFPRISMPELAPALPMARKLFPSLIDSARRGKEQSRHYGNLLFALGEPGDLLHPKSRDPSLAPINKNEPKNASAKKPLSIGEGLGWGPYASNSFIALSTFSNWKPCNTSSINPLISEVHKLPILPSWVCFISSGRANSPFSMARPTFL